MTIRKRLTLWYAGLLTLIIIVFGAITYGVMRFTMLSDIDSGLAETASLITRNSRTFPEPTFGAPTRFNIDLASLDLLRAPGVYVQAWEMIDGDFVFREASLTAEGLGNIPLDPAALGVSRDTIHNVTVAGLDMRVLTKPIIRSGGGEERLVGNIQVAVRLDTVNQATETLLAVMLILCGAGIIGAGLLSLWFSHRALQPIEDITAAAASIAQTNDLQTRLDWRGPNDELGRLTNVFNQMMRRIEHLFSVQQRFVADVSHELRTPLTSIQGHVDLMKRYGPDAMSLEAIEMESHRMARLVNDLLLLARADYGGLTVDLYPLDLDTVVMETFQSCKVLLKERDLTLRLGQFEPVRINGNADRIKQVVYNLVSNAVKFTPDGGEIVLGLEAINNHAVLWVKDTGIGISEDELIRVFDRFFQSESSRNHADDGGFGLGLSIAKWIVEAHDGAISASSKPGEGTVFSVTIPMLNANPDKRQRPSGDHDKPTRPRIPIIRREKQPTLRELRIKDSDAPGPDAEHDSNGSHEDSPTTEEQREESRG
ncbi:MAG: sensor histidine kinase [Chloroflexota bacterium]